MPRKNILFDRDTWQEIFGSIAKNKTRTIITVIGVLWGIFIYITLSGSAKGMDNGFDRAFENVAINSMFLWAQSTSMPYDGFKIGRSPQLKIQDAQYIKKRVPAVEFIAPRNTKGLFDGGQQPLVVRGTKTGNYVVYGDTPEYTSIFPLKIFYLFVFSTVKSPFLIAKRGIALTKSLKVIPGNNFPLNLTSTDSGIFSGIDPIAAAKATIPEPPGNEIPRGNLV